MVMESTITLDKNNLAKTPGSIVVYNFAPDSREYINSSTEYLFVGVGIPANACIEPPPQVESKQSALRSSDNTSWTVSPDFRGDTVYDIYSATPFIVTEIGALPANLTTLSPATEFDKWDGQQWITDTVAQHADEVSKAESLKKTLMENASEKISILQDAVSLGIATDDETKDLTAWQAYRVLLSRTDTSASPDVIWPSLPDSASRSQETANV